MCRLLTCGRRHLEGCLQGRSQGGLGVVGLAEHAGQLGEQGLDEVVAGLAVHQQVARARQEHV